MEAEKKGDSFHPLFWKGFFLFFLTMDCSVMQQVGRNGQRLEWDWKKSQSSSGCRGLAQLWITAGVAIPQPAQSLCNIIRFIKILIRSPNFRLKMLHNFGNVDIALHSLTPSCFAGAQCLVFSWKQAETGRPLCFHSLSLLFDWSVLAASSVSTSCVCLSDSYPDSVTGSRLHFHKEKVFFLCVHGSLGSSFQWCRLLKSSVSIRKRLGN